MRSAPGATAPPPVVIGPLCERAGGPPGGFRIWEALAWLSLAGLLALFLCRSWFGPDIWYHLALGRDILAARVPQPPEHLLLVQPGYVNVYWLYQLLVYGVYRVGGLFGVTVCTGLAWVAIALLWVRISRAPRIPYFGVWLALAALLIAQTRFEVRPEVFSCLFLMLHILWHRQLDTGAPLSPGRQAGFFAIQVAWTNMHGYFFLGPLVALLHLAAVSANGRTAGEPDRRADAGTLWRLVVIVLAATIVTPFGLGAWRMVFEYATVGSALRHEISEFQSLLGPVLRLWLPWLFWGAWAGTLATALRRLRNASDRFGPLLALAGLALSALASRNLPLLPLLSAPLWQTVSPPPTRQSRDWRHALGCTTAFALTLGLAAWTITDGFYRSLGGGVRTGIGLFPGAYPTGFLRYVESAPFAGTIFNHPDDGGFLRYHRPDARIYGDSRYVDVPLVREYFAALRDPVAFFALDRRVRFDGVLLKLPAGQHALLPFLLYSSWEIAYADLTRVFLVRDGTAASVLRIYGGEDLTLPEEGRDALRWLESAAAIGDRTLLIAVLEQFARAPALPAALVARALQLGLTDADPALVSWGRAMASRAIPRSAAEGETLAGLLAAAGEAHPPR